ncbi:glycosyltransferase [Salegentibacter holothuriorum]|uniref:glycosyltransferase n=1 Tax=Salegentibacter holothuriorum TaxID=241145 RepID=UPI0015910864|nr:glycosyltransferase [Salegentibacter holothuriorum]
MKVLIVNTFDRGGAANACKRLHLGLLEAGVESKVLLKNKQNNWSQSFILPPKSTPPSLNEKLKTKVIRILKGVKLYPIKPEKQKPGIPFLQKRSEKLEMYSFPHSNYDITQSPLYQQADIINLHWVANFLDYKSFFLKNTKPVVWTLHDMNPFLGIDHYAEKYIGMDTHGEPISRSISKEESKINRDFADLKKDCIEQIENLTVITPSRWLAAEASKSEAFKGRNVKVIPYGLDDIVFAPRDQKTSREILNLPLDKKIILFVADSVVNNRKGFSYLEKTLEEFQTEKILLCAVGSNVKLRSNDNLIELGEIKDDRLMSVVYSAADVFVIPSLIDNLPNTVLESIMCGTPVIGFPVGGIPDMIDHGKNGLLAEEISVKSLVKILKEFLDNPEVFDRKEIRRAAKEKYKGKVQAKKYMELFNEILKA